DEVEADEMFRLDAVGVGDDPQNVEGAGDRLDRADAPDDDVHLVQVHRAPIDGVAVVDPHVVSALGEGVAEVTREVDVAPQLAALTAGSTVLDRHPQPVLSSGRLCAPQSEPRAGWNEEGVDLDV